MILTSDHGEEFLEHGHLLHHQNYEEVARIPLIIRFPDRSHAGRRVGDLVSTLDVLPSILDAIGHPPLSQAMGTSLWNLLSDDSSNHVKRPVHIAGGREKLRTSDSSLMVAGDRPAELYLLAQDPMEQVNRLDDHPELAAQLFDRFRQIRAREIGIRDRISLSNTRRPSLTEDEAERLRALGYVEEVREAEPHEDDDGDHPD